MVKAAFDPRNITLYLKPRHLIHFEWQSSNKIYRYALVEVIDPKDINEKSKQNNDYESIMIKVIGDRIAEALAEKMHEDVRKKLWGYSSEENLNNSDLIKEKYIGIRLSLIHI